MRKLQLAMFVSFLGCLLTIITGCEPIKTSQCNINPDQIGCNPAFAVQTSRLLLTALSEYKVQLHLADISLYSRLLEVHDQLSVHLDQGAVSLLLPHIFKQPGLEATVPARLEAQLFHAGPAELRIQIGNERILLPTKLTAPQFKQSSFTKPTNGQIAWVGIPNRMIDKSAILTKSTIGSNVVLAFKQIQGDSSIISNEQCTPSVSAQPDVDFTYLQLISRNGSANTCFYSSTINKKSTITAHRTTTGPSIESYADNINGILPFTEPNLNLMLVFNATADNQSASSISVIGIMDSMNSKSNPIPIQLNTGSRNAFAIVTLGDNEQPYVMIYDADRSSHVRFYQRIPPNTFGPEYSKTTLIQSLTGRVNQLLLSECPTGNVRFVSGKVMPPVNKHWNDLVVACSSGIYVIERTDADNFQVPVQAHLFDSAKKRISTPLPPFNRIDIGALGGTMGDDVVLIQDDVGKRASDRIDFYVGVE